MQPSRRHFLGLTARLLSATSLATAWPGTTQAETQRNPSPRSYPFSLGVASGSPLPTGVVLWTRIVADPLDPEPFAAHPLSVQWEVAEDEPFKRIIAAGRSGALPELAHSVHVDVEGLQPGRWYWYRFMLGDAVSPVGRTRTAPGTFDFPDKLRFAFASCQHWEFGHYAAHRHIASAAPDLVAFLGDYIYEWGAYDLRHPAKPRPRSNESRNLNDYRMRYAQYKSDPDLQAAHQAAPWIVTWDDHEVANDYADDRDQSLDPHFLARRTAGYQAYYEHMPIRLPTLAEGPARYARLRLHQRYDWGRLARFHVLDTRQYRSYQACQPNGRGGSGFVTASCIERLDPGRTLLGAAQEQWLADGFASSTAQWNILAQQSLMAQHGTLPRSDPDDERFWTDGWDGYPAARGRLLDAMVKYRLANPLVISGDVHAFYAADLRQDFGRPASTANPVVATEFCGTSITSKSRSQAGTDRLVAHNPHIAYGRSDRRGFVMMEITPARAVARFQGLDDVRDQASALSTLKSFVVEDGRTGLAMA